MIWLDRYQDLCDIGKEWKLPAAQRTVDEWVEVAEKMAKKHGGFLPPMCWLARNGYKAMVNIIYQWPERFSHIKRTWKKIVKKTPKKTVEDHVFDASKIAEENGGVLPNPRWLRENGHEDLENAMYHHPEEFSHIKQKKIYKTVEEYIAEAEGLAKKHGGVLPSQTWLRENGYKGLRGMIQEYRRRFAHIKQEKPHRGKTVEKYIADANRLVKEYNGILPYQYWLRRHGYGGLAHAIDRYPELFVHIEQKSLKGKTVEEHIADAEKLAREHDGVLPSPKWLKENGYGGLTPAISRCPERFAHIRQEKLHKNLKERIVEAKELAKEHGGVIPSRRWLEENGHRGLMAMIRRRPELFTHINRMTRNKAA